MKEEGIAMKFYHAERWCYLHHFRIGAEIIYRVMQLLLGCTIPYTAVLEKGVIIAHFHGIVLNMKCFVGKGSVIYQNVTLGGINGKFGPSIGINCTIGAGAVILGDVNIGNNVKIGANAVRCKRRP